jgi:truncated hemoglobin YjbI
MQRINRAMAEAGVGERLRAALAQAFFGTADWMRNRPE